MFCPEVWNFKFPNDSVHVSTGLPSNLNHCENLIENHFFNHNVSVVLPKCPKVPEELLNCLIEDCDYYKVNLPICQLIEKEFISLFVCDGKLTALSVGTRIDVDDCAALTPTGTLILSLNRDTYQKLGIEGTPWGNSSTNPERYAVCIDLKKDCFKPGKPNYNKVFKSFTQLVPLRFDFILSWEPPSSHICPSSIALYLNDRGHDIRLCKPVSSYKSECVELPLLEDIEPDELIEWIGAFSLGILRKDPNLTTLSLEYLTTYDVPFDSENKSEVVMLKWTGFYTTDKLAGLFIKLRDYLVTNEGINIPWASFNVIGFADSPVSWGLKHNSYNTSGDNNYTIIFKPEKHLITFQVTTNNSKNSKNKQSKWVFINKNEKTENGSTPKEEKGIASN